MSEQIKDLGITNEHPLTAEVFDLAIEQGLEPTPQELRAVLGMLDSSIAPDEDDKALRFDIVTSRDHFISGQPYDARHLALFGILKAMRTKETDE